MLSRSLQPLLFLFAASASLSFGQSAAITDPRITSWHTTSSGKYARVYETTADKTSGNAVKTWPRAGLTNGGGGVATQTYSDVQRVAYSTTYVYITTTGLPSYTMGSWLTPNGMTYTSWPTNRAAIHRIPRVPSIPTTKQKTNGSGGVLVNGVFVWNNGDAQSYNTSTATVSMQGGQGIWNRLAGVAEAFNFDPNYGHQPNNGVYHNHVNPIGLRYQLGDNVTYNPSTKSYSEASMLTRHSPLIGWANDGLPIYGPYGYSSATDPNSGIRRMTSGFQKRDGTNGSTNLTSTGRTTLPKWAAEVQGRSQTLASTQYGPAVNASYQVAPGVTGSYSLGIFAEDYDYLGDLGKTQGTHFDLNRQNVRYCVTPEFPNGTYAYFVCIDASGNTVFPDIINLEFFGTAAQGQGTVTSISESVTEYARGGPAATITLNGTASGNGVALAWNSAEGATYKVESSANNSTWATLSSAVTSEGTSTTFQAAAAASYFRVTLTAIATYDTSGTSGTAVGTTGTLVYSLPVVAPTVSTPPTSAAVADGGAATFSVSASGTGPFTYQWSKNGTNVANATSASLTVSNVQPASTGIYRTTIANSAGTTTSDGAILGLSTTFKLVGTGTVFPDITHPSGRVYDQILLEAAAATITADATQVVRMSFLDLTNDIVQVEYSGNGSVSVVLDTPTGPAAPVNYNQSVTYMKGHVGIVVTGADENSHLSVFSVGKANAVNQALFRDDVTYDGWADLAFVAISSTNGKFGGLRTANGSYYNTKGITGVYAPGVQFTGPVYIGDINASDDAAAHIVIGSGTDVQINGGDLTQANGRAVQVKGVTQLQFKAGSTSHGVITTAQTNKARLEQNGVDVTTQLVVYP